MHCLRGPDVPGPGTTKQGHIHILEGRRTSLASHISRSALKEWVYLY